MAMVSFLTGMTNCPWTVECSGRRGPLASYPHASPGVMRSTRGASDAPSVPETSCHRTAHAAADAHRGANRRSLSPKEHRHANPAHGFNRFQPPAGGPRADAGADP